MFDGVGATERDDRVPDQLWELPVRVEQANAAGPRYNQSELAAASGLSQAVISKLSNRTNLYGIRLETIFKLAAALDVSAGWLLGESTTSRRPRRTKAATQPTQKGQRPATRRHRRAKKNSRP